MLLNFTKVNCVGNDFVIVDCITQKVYFSVDLIKRLSNRHFGIGFDRLILVEPPFDPDEDFHLRIFREDGSESPFSATSALCLLKFVIARRLTAKKDIVVSTISRGLKIHQNDDDSITVNLGLLDKNLGKDNNFSYKDMKNYKKSGNLTDSEYLISLGEKYSVIFAEDLKKITPDSVKKLKNLEENGICTSNIVFTQISNKNSLIEKCFDGYGREISCSGTGACACAIAAIIGGKLTSPVMVRMPVGSVRVEWDGSMSSPILMTSNVQSVFDGTVAI